MTLAGIAAFAARARAGLATLMVAALLAACSSTPKYGPGTSPPPDIKGTPDAVPRVEPIKAGGPNRPYEVLGKDYTPFRDDRAFKEKGVASWYGRKFHGKRTANGEVYDMYAMTAAHKTMPLPSYARVRNPANGREIIVRVNDRGPFHAGRVIDLSYTAAMRLGILNGIAPVEVERITNEDIRSGAWRRDRGDAPSTEVAAAPATVEANDEGVPDGPAVKPLADAPAGFWVQLGAFRERNGAESFQRHVMTELDALPLGVFGDGELFRLQAGPYASRAEAQAAAGRVRETLQLVPVVVQRR
jgi:rare lipoprotein A